MILSTHYKLYTTQRTINYMGWFIIHRIKKNVFIIEKDEHYMIVANNKAFAFVNRYQSCCYFSRIDTETAEYRIYRDVRSTRDNFKIKAEYGMYPIWIENGSMETIHIRIDILTPLRTILKELETLEFEYVNVGRCLYLEPIYAGQTMQGMSYINDRTMLVDYIYTNVSKIEFYI